MKNNKYLKYLALILIPCLALVLYLKVFKSNRAPINVLMGSSSDIKLGQTISADNGNLSITFNSVTNDSRCPIRVNCFWSGAATLEFKAQVKSNSPETVKIDVMSNSGNAEFQGYKLEVLKLSPERNEPEEKIRDYEVTLKITK